MADKVIHELGIMQTINIFVLYVSRFSSIGHINVEICKIY